MLKLNDGDIILASASPRRQELLKLLDIPFKVIPSDVDETDMEARKPIDLVLHLAQKKAELISKANPTAWVLGADTIVVLGEDIISKPTSKQDAVAMIRKLSNATHTVFTGFAIINQINQIKHTEVVASKVTFRRISDDEILWYVSTRESYDKAGGYALQGKGSVFVVAVDGSPSNVVGLPMSEVFFRLKELGAINFSGEDNE